MRLATIEVEPLGQAFQRREGLVGLLITKKQELETMQPGGLGYFEKLGDVALDLARAMGTVEQMRRLILFERFSVSLPPKLTPSRITNVNF